MSWIRGSFVIDNDTKDELSRANKEITRIVRENANLDEFPNMQAMNSLRVLDKTIYGSRDEAEQHMEELLDSWSRNYNPIMYFKDPGGTRKVLIGYEEYVG